MTLKIDASMKKLLYGLVIVLMAVSLAPTIFGNINDLDTSNGTPVWLKVTLPVVVGAGVLFMIWRAFD